MDEIPNRSIIPVNTIMNMTQNSTNKVAVNEIYLDGKLQKAEDIDEDEKSYGIFMHSLILSNYVEVMKVNKNQTNVIDEEYEKAIYRYTVSKGFNKGFIESIAPRINEMTCENDMKVSAHLINEQMRIISKGTPNALLERSSYILLDSKFVKITRRIYREVNAVLKDMLNRHLGVYAIAIKDISKVYQGIRLDMFASDMALVALVGMGKV